MGMPIRMLLVEDSRADAELVLAELRHGGYDPDYERVDTPEEMKAAVEKRSWEIILSDYVMPHFSGPAALKIAQESGLDLPFIMVTGQVGEETAVEAMRAGADDYVLKGNLTRLVPAIQRELRDAEVRQERNRAERARDRLLEELREARDELEMRVQERTEELDRLKDQFLSVAAHELKTPVTNIKGYAQLLLRREHEGVSPLGLRALDAVNRQTDRITRLVNELLEISGLQTGRLELHLSKFDLSQLAAETAERMKLTTEKHKLLFQSSGPVFVSGDRDRIEGVLSSLLDNAIKFSPEDGVVETAVGTIDGEAVVSVRDYGVGIPVEKQARVF